MKNFELIILALILSIIVGPKLFGDMSTSNMSSERKQELLFRDMTVEEFDNILEEVKNK